MCCRLRLRSRPRLRLRPRLRSRLRLLRWRLRPRLRLRLRWRVRLRLRPRLLLLLPMLLAMLTQLLSSPLEGKSASSASKHCCQGGGSSAWMRCWRRLGNSQEWLPPGAQGYICQIHGKMHHATMALPASKPCTLQRQLPPLLLPSPATLAARPAVPLAAANPRASAEHKHQVLKSPALHISISSCQVRVTGTRKQARALATSLKAVVSAILAGVAAAAAGLAAAACLADADCPAAAAGLAAQAA